MSKLEVEKRHDNPATNCAMFCSKGVGRPFCRGLKILECRYGDCNFFKDKNEFNYEASLRAANIPLDEDDE